MATLNDTRFKVLRQTLTGATNDMLLAYWVAQGGTGETMNDAKYSFLGTQGMVGTITDRWFQFLRQTYTGAISDMELQYWEDKVI